MSILKKSNIYSGLENLNVLFEDTDPNSLFFRIYDIPEILPAGKSAFRINGSNLLKENSEIKIEILNQDNKVVYTEYPHYLEGSSRLVSIFVYPDELYGELRLTIIGEAESIPGTVIPSEWQGVYNVRWSRRLIVDPNLRNDTKIRFFTNPTITSQEFYTPYLKRTYLSSSIAEYSTGKIEGSAVGGEYTLVLNDGSFNRLHVGAKLNIDNPTGQTQSYTTTIKKVINENIAIAINPYQVTSSLSPSVVKSKLLKYDDNVFAIDISSPSFDESSYNITYDAEPTFSITENYRSFTKLNINNIETFSGDIYSIKLFMKSVGSNRDYEPIGDTILESVELLIDSESIANTNRYGYFYSQDTITTFWATQSINIDNTLESSSLIYTNDRFLDGMFISASYTTNWGKSDYYVIHPNQLIDFFGGTEYSFESNFYGIKANKLISQISGDLPARQGKLYIFASGSAFYDTPDVPFINRGKLITILDVEDSVEEKNFGKIDVSFIADKTGNGQLQFVIDSGNWYVSDISLKTTQESGFSPGSAIIVLPINDWQRDDVLTFKAEFYNQKGDRADLIATSSEETYRGSNFYIEGSDNMLTGSLFIGGAIGTGIEFAGEHSSSFLRNVDYKGYYSASDGTGPGGFMFWKGAALRDINTLNGISRYAGVGLEVHGGSGSAINPTTGIGETHAMRFRTDTGKLEITGSIFATDGTFSGFLSASEGNIGGWSILPDRLESSGGGMKLFGDGRIVTSNFSLASTGNLTASNVLITGGVITDNVTILGSITANAIRTPALIFGVPSTRANASSSIDADGYALFRSASIGGWDISDTQIFSNNLIIDSAGILQTSNFVKDFSGWRITSDFNGLAEFENIRIRGTLRTTVFEKETINAVGGQLWIANSTVISGSDVGSTETTWSVDNATAWAANEVAIVKQVNSTGFTTEYIRIMSSSFASSQSYSLGVQQSKNFGFEDGTFDNYITGSSILTASIISSEIYSGSFSAKIIHTGSISTITSNSEFNDFTLDNQTSGSNGLTIFHGIFDRKYTADNVVVGEEPGRFLQDWSQGGGYLDTELIDNTGFETDTTSWAVTGNHTFQRITTDSVSGSVASLEVTASGVGNLSTDRIRATLNAGVESSVHIISFYAKNVSATGSIELHVGHTNQNNVGIFNLTNDWKNYEIMYTRHGASPSSPIFYLANAGVFRLDDVSYRELKNGNHLLPGDSDFYNNRFTGSNSSYDGGELYHFDGTTNSRLFSTSSVFDIGSGSVTYEARIKTTNTNAQTIISKYGSSGTRWQLRTQSGQLNAILITPAGTTNMQGATNIADGEEHHVAWVYESGSGTSSLWIDGNFETQQESSIWLSHSIVPIGNIYDFIIGGNTFLNSYWTGSIEEVRITNAALSRKQLQQYGIAKNWSEVDDTFVGTNQNFQQRIQSTISESSKLVQQQTLITGRQYQAKVDVIEYDINEQFVFTMVTSSTYESSSNVGIRTSTPIIGENIFYFSGSKYDTVLIGITNADTASRYVVIDNLKISLYEDAQLNIIGKNTIVDISESIKSNSTYEALAYIRVDDGWSGGDIEFTDSGSLGNLIVVESSSITPISESWQQLKYVFKTDSDIDGDLWIRSKQRPVTGSISSSTIYVDDFSIRERTPHELEFGYNGLLYVERYYNGNIADIPGQLKSGASSLIGDSGSLSGISYTQGQTIVSTGLIGTGYIRLNANPRDQYTPYIDIIERTGSGVYDLDLKVRLGDLSGISPDLLFGDTDPGFGLFTENVYLTGKITATSGSFTGRVHAGGLIIGSGVPASGETSLTAASGTYINEFNYWYDNGLFEVGNAINFMKWDNTTLSVSGTINAVAGNIGGWDIFGDKLSSGNVQLIASIDDDSELIIGSTSSQHMIFTAGSATKFDVYGSTGTNQLLQLGASQFDYGRIVLYPSAGFTIPFTYPYSILTARELRITGRDGNQGSLAITDVTRIGASTLTAKSSCSLVIGENADFDDQSGDFAGHYSQQGHIAFIAKDFFILNKTMAINTATVPDQPANSAILLHVDSENNVFNVYGLFILENNLQLTGHIEATGSITSNSTISGSVVIGGRSHLHFGRDADLSATSFATTTVDAVTVNGAANTQGYRMLRQGRVTGVSVQYNITSTTGADDTFKVTIQKNASNQSMVTEDTTITANSDNVGHSSTSNDFLFQAGDRINVELEVISGDPGTITVDDIAVLVEIIT